MKKIIINAIIVTYNRKFFLKKVLAGLIKQTYPINKIIVVDNCSSDGTWKYLNMISRKYKNLKIIKNKDNLGMANAVNLALKKIWKENWDAVWISDDDNIASFEALKKLVNHYNKNTILNSILLDDKDKNKLTFPLVDLDSEKIFFNLKELIKKKQVKINYAAAFNFTLVSKNILKNVGFLDDQYFIRGEEIDFITRAILKDFKLETIIDSQVFCLNRRIIKKFKILNIKIAREMIDYNKNYYIVRNTLFLLKKYQKKILNSNKKNILYKFYPYYKYPLFIFIIFYSFYILILSLIFYKKNRLKIISSTLLAYYHFLINKRGKYQL